MARHIEATLEAYGNTHSKILYCSFSSLFMEVSDLSAPFSVHLFSYSTSFQQQLSQGGYNKRMLTKCYNHAGQRQLSHLFSTPFKLKRTMRSFT